MEKPKKPRFTHDCKKCVYLGRCDSHKKGKFSRLDLYWCPSTPGASIIARFANDGPEYFSTLPPDCFGQGYKPHSEWVKVALARALERDLYRPWEYIAKAKDTFYSVGQSLELFDDPQSALDLIVGCDFYKLEKKELSEDDPRNPEER